MPTLRRASMAALAAPLTLALAACGGSDEGTTSGDPLDTIVAPEGTNWNKTVSRTEEGGWLVGNPDAPIKLVEYGSLTCPACANFSVEGSDPLHEEYIATGRVSYEFRSMLIHGVIDLLLTRMLECAPQTAAVPLADEVWGNLNDVTGPFQANQSALEQAMTLPEEERFVAVGEAGGLFDFFASRGISSEQGRQCLSDVGAITQLAEVTQESASEQGVNSTPTFFVNGNRIDATRWSGVEEALQDAGAR